MKLFNLQNINVILFNNSDKNKKTDKTIAHFELTQKATQLLSLHKDIYVSINN